MVYTMKMKVDGGCRRNGYSDAVGAAAVVLFHRTGGWNSWSWALPSSPTPTSQRAELTAIVHALEMARDKIHELDGSPVMKVTISTDSKYAHGCMTNWSYKWRNNGWINAAGNEVANRDLVEEAIELEDEIDRNGSVTFRWIPRDENQIADKAVNDELNDMQEDTDMRDEYESSSEEDGW